MRNVITLALLLTSSLATAASLDYLGPRGTYSDQAAQLYAAQAGLTVGQALPTITAGSSGVATGHSQYGVIPN